ncbi:MAG: RNA polymerase sigma factor [Herbaspirillum sp.]
MTDDQALRRRLVALARHWLAQADEAEDLVQETWLRSRDGTLPAEATGREAWLVTVLRHLCIDTWRRQGRHKAVLEQLAGDGTTDIRDHDPEVLAEQAERVEQALLHMVHALPAGDVAAVLLYEVFGFSHAELGVLAGRSEAASRQQLRRMLLRLRQTDPIEVCGNDDTACLLALCRWALAQRDPAGLVAVLRTARPQAMAQSTPAMRQASAEATQAPATRLIQIGNLLALQIQVGDGPIAWLFLGDTCTEPVSIDG